MLTFREKGGPREISLSLFSKLNAWVILEKSPISNRWLIHIRITIVLFRNHYMIKCSSKSNLRPPCYFLAIHPFEKRKTRVFLNSRTDPFPSAFHSFSSLRDNELIN